LRRGERRLRPGDGAGRDAAGHLDFRAELLDDAGNATSADRGHSYKKLLCIAFDLAVLRAHLDERELVELTATVAAYNMVSRFLEALQIEIEA